MVLLNPITDQLKSLRLTGMLKGFEEQMQTQLYDDLSFFDRMAHLLERESLERTNAAMTSRLGKARLREQAEIEDVRVSSSRGIDKTQLRALASGDWIRAKTNVIITGASGCGKTYLSSALGRRACVLGYTSRYYRASNILADLEFARGEGRLQRLIRQQAKIDVLIIDDFCLSALTEAEEKDLFELIEERYRTKATVFVSQNPINTWHGLMPNPAIADAILDRIVHGATRIELKGGSRRKMKDEPPELDGEREPEPSIN
jgi:DNA replication protein DnaC